VDLGGPGADEGWRAAELAPAFPSAPVVAIVPPRASDAATLGRCAHLGVADVLVDGIDDAIVRESLAPLLFTGRFARAFADPPPPFGLRSPLQQAAWRHVVGAAGRLARTDEVAAALGVTREHLSRSFGDPGPSLKRMIDLVRVVVAAELSHNPGHQIRDVAAVLGFASSSHLAYAARRVAGITPAALGRVTATELIARFVETTGSMRRTGGHANAADRLMRGHRAGADGALSTGDVPPDPGADSAT
jgi:AraC-like DNA-binding protein